MNGKALTAMAVADIVGGRLSGDGEVLVSEVRALSVATRGSLTVCSNERFLPELEITGASVVLIAPEFMGAPGPSTRVIVAEPMRAAAKVAAVIHGDGYGPPGIHPTASIGRGSVIGDGCRLDAGAVIGDGVVLGPGSVVGAHAVLEDNVRIGNKVRLDPHVVVQEGSVLGDRVHCKAGAIIGGPGFGFLSSSAGHERIPQVGGCILGDDVEVGANSCIDRGSLNDTVIGRGTKIDNLVHVAHNVRIGEDCLLMAGVGVSGSTIVGDRVVLAGQSGLVGHIRIGDDAKVGAQAGVISSVPDKGVVSGFPARSHREFLRAQAALYRLVEHVDELEAVAKREADA